MVSRLQKGNPAVYVRGHFANVGILFIDPRPMLPGDAQLVIQRLKELADINDMEA